MRAHSLRIISKLLSVPSKWPEMAAHVQLTLPAGREIDLSVFEKKLKWGVHICREK